MDDRLTNSQLAAAFDQHLELKGRAPGTRVKYRKTLRTFAAWAAERPAADISRQEVELFLAAWRQQFTETHGRAPSLATVKAQITTLRAFYTYLEQTDLLGPKKNPAAWIEAPRVPQKANDWLRADEDQALLAAAGTPSEEIIVWLLRWTGLRVHEASNLRFSDVHLVPGAARIEVQTSKTAAGVRTVPIPPELLPRIQKWIDHLRARGLYSLGGPFLPTRSGKPMAPTYIGRVLKRVAYQAGVRAVQCDCGATTVSFHARSCAQTANGENRSKISPHTLRRTYGSYYLNKGVRLEVVSKLLGHTSTTITEKAYAQLLSSTVRDELFAMSPPGFRGDCFDWFPTLIKGLVLRTYRLA